MPKKPFLKKLFKKNKFNPKNTSYNKEVSDLQKHALTNPISMSEAENDIETSYTDNTSTHIVIDTSKDNIDTRYRCAAYIFHHQLNRIQLSLQYKFFHHHFQNQLVHLLHTTMFRCIYRVLLH